ncbi:MAG: DNA-directed RNA polymerase subunit omega [Candidatus Omnitrophota bacterium]
MGSNQIPVEKLLYASGDSIYRLTILAAKRALQLSDGDNPLVENPGKALNAALNEILEGKIRAKSPEKKT